MQFASLLGCWALALVMFVIGMLTGPWEFVSPLLIAAGAWSVSDIKERKPRHAAPGWYLVNIPRTAYQRRG